MYEKGRHGKKRSNKVEARQEKALSLRSAFSCLASSSFLHHFLFHPFLRVTFFYALSLVSGSVLVVFQEEIRDIRFVVLLLVGVSVASRQRLAFPP